MLNNIILLFVFLFTPLLVAESTQTVVAIKKPTINDSISKNFLNIIDNNIIRSEIAAALTTTHKFKVLSADNKTLKAVQEEPALVPSDMKETAATVIQNKVNYLIVLSILEFELYRKYSPLSDNDRKFKRRDFGKLSVIAEIKDTSNNQIVTTFSIKTSFAGEQRIVNESTGSPDLAHFNSMSKKVAAKIADQFVATLSTEKPTKQN